MTARPPHLQVWLDGGAVALRAGSVLALDVEERSDEASSARIMLDLTPVGGSSKPGDWDALEYGPFAAERGVPAFRLLSRVTVAFGFEAGADETAITATVFDGYVTAVEPVIGRGRVPDSYLVLTCLDASCLMHLETVTRTWDGQTDAQIAAEIFGKYGFACTPGDTIEDSGVSHDADLPGLVQRGTDAEFLRMLARRNGFEWYIEPAGDVHAGTHPGHDVVGHFHSPRVGIEPQPELALFPRLTPTLQTFRARFDSHQPTRVRSWHIDERSRALQYVDLQGTDLMRMGTHSRADVVAERLSTIQPVKAGAATATTVATGRTSAGSLPATLDIASGNVPCSRVDLGNLARASLRVADWFVTGTGTVQSDRYPAIVRSRRPVTVSGAGHLLDGRWYVQAVRHRWGVDPAEPEREQRIRRYEADVTVVRNALSGAA
ncbi:Phage protein D [Mycolicibacterium mageritense DSM 44476 = CIP 104973]|uniref:contractile injection system protein, VgrG/Pvc8 family n=1 Tax=Mycolicibacterium mageritense TaxID=53462 RepID=UPI000431F73F|nr:contractile injection system protein, VgrG/Pvc8 family [Mycolicibacterium mageritense]CDO24321.1 Phage protein D [Mycolicibacterium mageritense DSM 44476 = CIP 104973]